MIGPFFVGVVQVRSSQMSPCKPGLESLRAVSDTVVTPQANELFQRVT